MRDPSNSGYLQTHCLNASRDTALAISTLPGLMIGMMREEGWKEMARPIDGKIFTHQRIEDWVLGEPWGGLNFKSWDILYAILDRSEEGREARKMLIARGAPENGFVEDVTQEMKSKSLRQIAREKGIPKDRVRRSVAHNAPVNKAVWLAADPAHAAQTILKARGAQYAAALAGRLAELAIESGQRVSIHSKDTANGLTDSLSEV